jgi:metal-responsive CopG/Arc/MetJ family transcriptional regulator
LQGTEAGITVLRMSDQVHTVRLPAALGAQLEEAKWTLRKSKSDIIKEALTAYLATAKPSKAKAAKAPKGQL